jgi:hypothetical protein
MKTIDNAWTDKEIDFLQKMYPYMRVSAIADILTRHTKNGIYRKARDLMLRADKYHVDEAKLILEMREAGTPWKEISDRLGYPRQSAYRLLMKYLNEYSNGNKKFNRT